MWEIALEKIILPIARTLAEIGYRIIREKVIYGLTVEDFPDCVSSGVVSYNNIFKIRGVFSEYLPFVDYATLINTKLDSNISGSCRLGDLVKSGTYIGALFSLESTKSTDPAIPLIYGQTDKSKKMFSFSTGDIIELECRLIPLDYEFRQILYNNEYFVMNDKPFGLEILDVYTKKVKKVDSFEIDAFFLTSFGNNIRFETFLENVLEITNMYEEITNLQSRIGLGAIVYQLAQEGFLEGIIKFEGSPAYSNVNWVTKDLCRFSNRFNIMQYEESEESINSMIDIINSYSYIQDEEEEGEWSLIYNIIKKGTAYLDKIENNEKLSELKKDKELKTFHNKLYTLSERIYNNKKYIDTLEIFANPKLNVEFGFDQIKPFTKQTLDVRKILKERGFD